MEIKRVNLTIPTWLKLTNYKAQLQTEHQRRVTMDEAVRELLKHEGIQ